jgi:hypothetical protein
MTSVKSLATRFYRLKPGHAPTGVLRTQRRRQVLVVRRDDNTDAGAPLSPLQPVERPSEMLWKAVGKATGWKAGRFRHVQVSELFSMEKCDQAVMDFLVATDVGKFPPK